MASVIELFKLDLWLCYVYTFNENQPVLWKAVGVYEQLSSNCIVSCALGNQPKANVASYWFID
jgi:hypothetical protein